MAAADLKQNLKPRKLWWRWIVVGLAGLLSLYNAAFMNNVRGSYVLTSAIWDISVASSINATEGANFGEFHETNVSAVSSSKQIQGEMIELDTRSTDTAQTAALNTWTNAILETTKLIYRDSPSKLRDFWLSQPPPTIFIYDSIPAPFSDVETISECVNERFLGGNRSEMWKDNCLWRPGICQDSFKATTPKPQMFVSYRNNYNTDVAYLDKFRRYPFQTDDPTQADVFIVPYPHKSHCLCHKDFTKFSSRCMVPFDAIQQNVLKYLKWFSSPKLTGINQLNSTAPIPKARQRHLFFHGADWYQELKPFRGITAMSITLSLGPVLPCVGQAGPCGHVAVPYLTTDPGYQPHTLSTPPQQEERAYALGAALASTKALEMRRNFLKKWKSLVGEVSTVDGKPHRIISMGSSRGGRKPRSKDLMNLYRNSTVCLILPGDGCAQKRFFDALLNGCIPFVPVYPSNEKDWPHSFHHSDGCSTRVAYPYAKGSFGNDRSAGFDIMDMVVGFNGTCGLECMQSALEIFLSNKTAIKEKRENMDMYASVITFGLTEESNSYPDTFAALLVRLRHHVWHLLGRLPPSE